MIAPHLRLERSNPRTAALLNITGTGAGYLYLGLPLLFVVNALAVAGWILLTPHSRFWLVVLGIWILLTVLHARNIAGQSQAPRRPGRARTALAFVLACLPAALVWLPIINYRTDAEDLLDLANKAHAEGRCDDAVTDYDRVISDYGFASASEDAEAPRRACKVLLSAEDLAKEKRYDDAIDEYEKYIDSKDALFASGAEKELAAVEATALHVEAQTLVGEDTVSGYQQAYDKFVELVTDYPDSAEAQGAADEVNAMYDEALTGRTPCASVEMLELFAGLPGNDGLSDSVVPKATAALPGAQQGCEAEKTQQAEQDIKDQIADAQSGGESLPPPQRSGSAPGGTTTVEIINQTVESLELLYTGPATGRVPIPPGSSTCDSSNPGRQVLTLPPGDYQVAVNVTSSSGVIPFGGTWSLASGTAYSNCYYITTVPG